jgi:hypothetical protein
VSGFYRFLFGVKATCLAIGLAGRVQVGLYVAVKKGIIGALLIVMALSLAAIWGTHTGGQKRTSLKRFSVTSACLTN